MNRNISYLKYYIIGLHISYIPGKDLGCFRGSVDDYWSCISIFRISTNFGVYFDYYWSGNVLLLYKIVIVRSKLEKIFDSGLAIREWIITGCLGIGI